jgi:hypothetical protein
MPSLSSCHESKSRGYSWLEVACMKRVHAVVALQEFHARMLPITVTVSTSHPASYLTILHGRHGIGSVVAYYTEPCKFTRLTCGTLALTLKSNRTPSLQGIDGIGLWYSRKPLEIIAFTARQVDVYVKTVSVVLYNLVCLQSSKR